MAKQTSPKSTPSDEPRTFHEVVRKATTDSAYAKRLCSLVARACRGDTAAEAELTRSFVLTASELKELGLPPHELEAINNEIRRCPIPRTVPTTAYMLAFVAFLRAEAAHK